MKDNRPPLSNSEVMRLEKAISKNADKLISDHYNSLKRKPVIEDVQEETETKATKLGRKPAMLSNTIIDYIGKTTIYGLYPYWALDIIEGVARLDWDSKPTDSPNKSSPLSVKKLCLILSSQEEINTKEISLSFDIQERHARRYMQACKLMMPYLERSVPNNPTIKCVKWLDLHDFASCPLQIAQLQYDMRDL